MRNAIRMRWPREGMISQLSHKTLALLANR